MCKRGQEVWEQLGLGGVDMMSSEVAEKQSSPFIFQIFKS